MIMKKAFFSGINGIGMSGLALILKELGYEVSGSDIAYKEISKKLEDNGIKVYVEQKRGNVEGKDIDLYVYSTAIKENNPEYMYMVEKNIKMVRRGELLAEIMDKLPLGIAVAGTHGKTTTSSLATVAFLDNDPYVAVGGIVPEIGSNSRVGNSEYFIAEADESDNSFLYMHPFYSIITNIEADHLEFHGSLENIKRSFGKFIDQTRKMVLACYDCEEIRSYENDKIVFYSVYEENKDKVRIYAKNIHSIDGKTYFDVVKNGEELGTFKLSIPGVHNVSNALAVIYIAHEEKLDMDKVKERIEGFRGANRRYQVILDEEFKVIDDYAHHPTEIKATINAAKMNEKKEIIVIFEPHRYSRTKFFLNEFAESLSLADKVYLLPIYSASEENIYDVSSEDLAKLVGEHSKVYEKDELTNILLEEDKKGKVYIFMGAGSVSAYGHKFVEMVK
ncbi:UDP-N-acetylmuramate--L-alanine ligase [Streptobacillus felis]|uniref:UDP-N-acetylmuramate--L-alanine ligase n=2 Tax=Streptobacillus felis TaxID=1384509 RepID=A0A7Z0PF53_9FUSO|nr:UDP-N-acetylmuramate--L-alanine ligase [Streptobacillus felis]NYV27646.1 UDP-N-acetylmuramate--L-alanine ligase [Streptobacillus felis]